MSNDMNSIPKDIVATRRDFFENLENEAKTATPKKQETVKTDLSAKGQVSVGKEISKQHEIETVAIVEYRDSEVLGRIPPPLSQHPMGEDESPQLTNITSFSQEGKEVEVEPQLEVAAKQKNRISLKEEVGTSQADSGLSLTLPRAQDTAATTEHVAFNNLEKFVSFFSKSKAKEMRSNRLNGMVDHVHKHLHRAETAKAAKALVQLEIVSPSRFKTEITQLNRDNTLSSDKVLAATYDQLTEKYNEIDNKTSSKATSLDQARNEVEQIVLPRLNEFTRADTYDDVQAKQGNKDLRVMKDTPISFLPTRDHVQSVFRLPNKLDLIIKKGDQEKQILWNKEIHKDRELKDQEATSKDLFEGINEMLGRDMKDKDVQKDIAKKIEVYTNFDATDESVNAFDTQKNKIAQNEDVLILKFVTKEMLGYAVAPLAAQLKDFCIDNHFADDLLTVSIKDQVEKCNVKLNEDGSGFSVSSEVVIPLKSKGVMGDQIVGSVKVNLTAVVDSRTGDATIAVERSDLAFNNNASVRDKLFILRALNEPLPDSLPQEPMNIVQAESLSEITPSLEELKSQLTSQTQFKDIVGNKPLFNAMKEFFEKKYSDELFIFAEELEKGEKLSPEQIPDYYERVFESIKKDLNLPASEVKKIEHLKQNPPPTTKELNEQLLTIISESLGNMWIGMRGDFKINAK